ncbi:MAG: methyltransferase type 11, partial [Spirochaetes bacterium]|nr:methyltransferase type 11 [Spirochaetota bacterium]
AEKEKVFKEVGRVLRKGGRIAISDIVTEKELTKNITCNATLWASCIGGAMQENKYRSAIEKAGMCVVSIQVNPQYQFLTKSAQGASKEFGVKSISLLAEKVDK